MSQQPVQVNIDADPGLNYLSSPTIELIAEGKLFSTGPGTTSNVGDVMNSLQRISTVVYVNNTMHAGGANNEVQINIDGNITGDNEFRYDANTNVLTTGGLVLTGNLSVYGTSNLGNVSSLKIGAGNPGQFLVSQGNSNVNWGTPSDYQLPSDWNALIGVQRIVNKPLLANIATTGSYYDLHDAPNLALVATTANYVHLINRPVIPGNTSQLQNDSGFLTASDIANINLGNATFNTVVDWANVINKPSNVSEFTNDAGYMTLAEVQTYVAAQLASVVASINIDGGTSSSTNITTIDGGAA